MTDTGRRSIRLLATALVLIPRETRGEPPSLTMPIHVGSDGA